jgi:metal-responsive CopG/Arc/MetJ family transcriptional regulator
MAKQPAPPRKGARISIYIQTALLEQIDEAAYAARLSRSRYLTNVITKATQQGASRLRRKPVVSGLRQS